MKIFMRILILTLIFIFNYSCVSIAEGKIIKSNIAKMDAKYNILENNINEDQNKFKRKLRRVDVKLLELDKILKEARKLLHRNNADFGQDIEQMDLRVKRVEGKNEEILFKFEQLQKKFKELKENINDLNGNIAISHDSPKDKDNNHKVENEITSKTKNNNFSSSIVNRDYKKINNPIGLFKLGYSYIDGKKYKSMTHKEKMNKAIEIFKYLIKKFPKHNKANSARYWITQAYYSSAQYEKAYRSLNNFLKKYPTSRHIPQVLFQMGNSLKQLGIKKDAKTIFRTLIKLYPKSGYSKKAKVIIKNL